MDTLWFAVASSLAAACGVALLSVVLWNVTRTLGRLRDRVRSLQERDLLSGDVSQRSWTDARLQLLIRASESAEDGCRALIVWGEALHEVLMALAFDSDGPERWTEARDELRKLSKQASRAALLLPPALDPPYHTALKCLGAARDAAQRAAREAELGARRETCRDAMQNSQAELDRFVNAVRTWKKRAWNEAMGIPEGSSIPPPSLRP